MSCHPPQQNRHLVDRLLVSVSSTLPHVQYNFCFPGVYKLPGARPVNLLHTILHLSLCPLGNLLVTDYGWKGKCD